MVNAVVLGGGGRPDERLADLYRGPSKGLIQLGGKPSVQYVLEALRATPGVRRIALAGPSALLEHPAAQLADLRLEEEGGIVEKLAAAARAFGDGQRLLMAGCDIPLVTPEVFADIIDRCPEETAFFHPLVRKSAALRDFPEHKWVFLKLRDGSVVTTNVIILDPTWLDRRPDIAVKIEELRRHPIRMALQWGLLFLLKFKLGLLSLDYCERFFSDFLQAPVRGAITDHTELAMDLDRPEDAPMLERRLVTRGAP
ncbi:MAG: nucleotidyltransferase family protein [Armatimonadota bacterium]|nr:nucleotidyltransferase family protein [Armatimonadota bacterium]